MEKWERVVDAGDGTWTMRLRVPGGYLYHTIYYKTVAMCFVPDPPVRPHAPG
jgi:hypothetical protein